MVLAMKMTFRQVGGRLLISSTVFKSINIV